MKRDLDLARQLLFDIESHGAHCAVSSLRTVLAETADDVIRYHLRILIDAQLVKEVDRAAAGAPCVRLTNSGHELLDLARSDDQWHQARQCVEQTTGGQSLTVLKAVLVKWAVEAATHPAPGIAPRRYRPGYHRIARPQRYAYSYLEREPVAVEPRVEVTPSRTAYRTYDRRPAYDTYRERLDWRDAYDRDVYYPEYRSDLRYAGWTEYDRAQETTVGVSLPVALV